MLENVTRKPFANPSSSLPRYRTPGEVVPIWMAHVTAFTTHASHSAARRPRYAEKNPATSEEMKDPRVRREVINCWTVLCGDHSQSLKEVRYVAGLLTSIAYPISDSGSRYPKTLRKPGIAWSDPTAARSNPYCILAIETRQQRKRHLRFCHRVVSDMGLSAMMIAVKLA